MRTTVATDTRLLGIGGVDWWRRRGSGGRRTGSLNSRERNAALGSLTTLDGGRYANLISRKWTSWPLGSSVRAYAATLMRERLLEEWTVSARQRGARKPILLRSHDRPASKWACNLRIATATLFDDICENQRCATAMAGNTLTVTRESSSWNWNSPNYRESWCH